MRFAPTDFHILLVEDNITNQQVALGLLKKLGLAVTTVINGEEAVTALQSGSYDLVLMDCQMPVLDGYEATREIRSARGKVLNQQIPIIALTANALPGDREKCLQAGMDDYLTKPFTLPLLAQVLDKWLPGESIGAANDAADSTIVTAVSDIRVIFDRQGLLQRVTGDERLARKLVAGFLGDIPGRITQLHECLITGDSYGTAMIAHTIKGAAATVGAESLRAVALQIEKVAKLGDSDRVGEYFAELQEQFESLRWVLEKFRTTCH